MSTLDQLISYHENRKGIAREKGLQGTESEELEKIERLRKLKTEGVK